MGVKMEKVKNILNFTKDISGAVLDLVEMIDKTTSPKKEQMVYEVSRYDEKGNKITLCSIQEQDGTWHYYKSIDNGFRVAFNYYNSMPTQKELDKMKA